MVHAGVNNAVVLSKTSAIVLAAGQGTRMKSATPKVLHPICGRPLLYYPVRAALDAGCAEVVVVVGHGREGVESFLKETFGDRVKIAVQAQQRGTGDAARSALPAVSSSSTSVLVYYGDVPLLTSEDVSTVARAYHAGGESCLAMATCTLEDPTGYGRILRGPDGRVKGIREQKDCSAEERAIQEINPGIYVCSKEFLVKAVESLEPNNAQGEYYLTDIVAKAVRDGLPVLPVDSRKDVVVGVNDRAQLAAAEEILNERILHRWRIAGVTIRAGVRIDDSVVLEPDVTLETGVVLRGRTTLRRGAHIDVGSVITNGVVAENGVVRPYSVIGDSSVGARAQVGPFSHLRPDSVVGDEAHVGNFVEMKKTRLGVGAKANHLAYLGDGIVGDGANVGAGTIFCNYDGFRKHTTVIGKKAFIGSDSQIVAPVVIGDGAYVATGTTVTKDVPADALAISRVRQENKEGYAPRLRERLKASK